MESQRKGKGERTTRRQLKIGPGRVEQQRLGWIPKAMVAVNLQRHPSTSNWSLSDAGHNCPRTDAFQVLRAVPRSGKQPSWMPDKTWGGRHEKLPQATLQTLLASQSLFG